MKNAEISSRFARLSTPLICDASLRLDLPLRIVPPGLRPATTRTVMAGRAVPVRHYGSVDVFLEAIARAEAGDVLVIDNGGRTDEGCIGDLTALEAEAAGLSGIVLWGSHRDSTELHDLNIAILTNGSFPAGPRRLDRRNFSDQTRVSGILVDAGDVVFGDQDGVMFVRHADVGRVLSVADGIQDVERRQADAIRKGTALRTQLRFDEYLQARSHNDKYTLREHLQKIGGAVEV